jgi:hypothetical protein
MRKPRRETEVFSLSFLDVITCGFGAIILLLVVAKTGVVPILETSTLDLDGLIRERQAQLFEIRGEARILNEELNAKHEQRSEWEERVARLRAELELTKKRYASLRDDSAVNTIVKGELEAALQTLTEEMKRLLARQTKVQKDLVGGIPIDSEYVIFVIDTSGSMRTYNWENMIRQMIMTLDIYPHVKGLQILNADGAYLFSQYRRRWIPDTPGRRKVIMNALRSWVNASNSDPVPGIITAVKDFYDPKKKVSVYVFGDDFNQGVVTHAIDLVDRANPRDVDGNRRVRVHAVGFPAPREAPEGLHVGNGKFASLMREMTRQNDGTFVGLNYSR